MACRMCNTSSNFVLMTGKPVQTPMNKYIDYMRLTGDTRFSTNNIEVILGHLCLPNFD